MSKLQFYEGDTSVFKIDLSDNNLPGNSNITFCVDLGNNKVIKKEINSDGIIRLSEIDTLGLTGNYLSEIRLNNEGLTKVLWQGYINILDSITVSGEATGTNNTNNNGSNIINDDVKNIIAITDEEIERLL